MNTSTFNIAATDTSKLQSAWSAYDPRYYGICDSKADKAFSDCANYFIYANDLRAPLPEDDKGITNPFMDLWFDYKGYSPYPKMNPFTAFGGHIDIDINKEDILKSSFIKDLKREPNEYRDYIQFQFCDNITDEYISRTSGSKIDPADLILEAKTHLGDINSKFGESIIEKFNSIILSKWHSDICKLRARCSIGEYALSYAYSGFRRGRQYQECLGGSAYDSHWIRVTAQYLHGIDKEISTNRPFLGYADWGATILKLRRNGNISGDVIQFKDILTSLRESAQSGKYDLSNKAKEDQVKMLENAKRYAKYSKTPIHYNIGMISKDFLKSLPIVGPVLSETVSIIEMFGKSSFIEKLDARLTRVMSFKQFEKAFYLEEIIGNKHDNN
jgi:hypothetical protein